MKAKDMTARHVKAARALLGLNAQEFAELLPIGIATLRNFESGKEINAASHEAIFLALQDHGVVMQNGGSPGVRITEPDKWAVNLEVTACPECGHILPAVRTPKNLRQFIWGGWTCSECGAEVTKLGKRLLK